MTDPYRVFVTEGTFGVLDNGVIAVETADWSNGLVAPMTQGALIVTGINTGYVEVTVLAQDSPPAELAAGTWEEIIEVSLHAPTGNLQVESLDLGPVANDAALLAPSGAAWYRLRVHAEGRETLRDKTSMEPVERYLLITWPGAREDTAVLRASENLERSLHMQLTNTVQEPTLMPESNPPTHRPN
ncbi:hypothetical protein ACFWOB_43775 [Streptomyces sp. NPDC058420]|uniref:hypothetical protein n=1 Tax=Streptomyces sp. NPDC058420 TaxID=3346489 RepID=UPI00364CE216